jgi:hypothetical protein
MMLLLLLLAFQWLQAMMLLLLVLPRNLVVLSYDVPLPCDFCHDLLLNNLMAPSHNAFLTHVF